MMLDPIMEMLMQTLRTRGPQKMTRNLDLYLVSTHFYMQYHFSSQPGVANEV